MEDHKGLPGAKFHQAVMFSLWGTMCHGQTDTLTDWLTDWQTEAILRFHFVKPKWNENAKVKTSDQFAFIGKLDILILCYKYFYCKKSSLLTVISSQRDPPKMFPAQTEVNAFGDVIQRKAPYNPNGQI